ncbi:MAG: hypothetical protein ACD_42C00342G0004 [uncultured bacterium]|nr:MAG: hypothetical protein ACD_42C00342G0004 [uncultured bacterium]
MGDFLKQALHLFRQYPARLRFWITVALMMLIFLIWYFLFYRTISPIIQSNSEKINVIQHNIAAMNALYQENLRVINSPISTLEQKKRDLEKMLHELETNTFITKKMMDTKEDYRNAIRDISTLPEAISFNQIDELPNADSEKISIEFSGGYFETLEYLQYLENLPWYILFNSLEYTVTSYPNAKVTLIMSLPHTPKGASHG